MIRVKRIIKIQLLAFFLPGLVISQETDTTTATITSSVVPCSRYHGGSMVYKGEPFDGIKIKRSGKKQIEINTETKAKTIFEIEWETDCKYILTFVKSTQPSRLKKGWKTEVEITDAFPEYYDFKSDLHGIYSYGTIEKKFSALELKTKQQAEEKIYKDSINKIIADSLAKVHNSETLAKALRADSLAKAKDNTKVVKKEGEEEEENKDPNGEVINNNEEGNSKGEEEEKSKSKKEKKEKVKKEKKVKEEKAPKVKKEKKPKEKKEKGPEE